MIAQPILSILVLIHQSSYQFSHISKHISFYFQIKSNKLDIVIRKLDFLTF